MKKSFFFDGRPFIYIFSGLIGYMIGIWLAFSDISTHTVMVELNEFGRLECISAPSCYSDLGGDGDRIVSPSRDFLNWHPAYLKFGLFISLLTAFAVAILIPSLLLNVKLVRDFSLHKNWKRNVTYILFVVVFGVLFFQIEPIVSELVLIPDELFTRLGVLFGADLEKKTWIGNLIVLSGLFCFLGLFLLNLIIEDRNARNSHDEEIETALQAELQKYFRFFSLSLSILIAGGMLTSALLRAVVYSLVIPSNAEVVNSPEWEALSPSDFILNYGLNHIIFLAVVLVPSFFFIHRSGQLALKRIQFHNPAGGAALMQQFTPPKILFQKLWLAMLILMPFLALFANKFLNFLAKQLE